MPSSRPEDSLDHLLQSDVITELLPKIGREQWQTLYRYDDQASSSLAMWCALLDDRAAARAIEHAGWDLIIDDYRPGFSQGWQDGEEIIRYHTGVGDDGVKPLLRRRSFHGAFPAYFEVDEEFRLYHNLAEDRDRGLLLDFDDSGREIEVVRVKPKEIQARLKYLFQFQAATRLNLAVYVDSRRFSTLPFAEIPAVDRERSGSEGCTRWWKNVAQCDFKEGYSTFSRLLAKVIFAPPAKENAGIWPYEGDDSRKTVSFIVGTDDGGNDVEHTSDPDTLANNFGANQGAPHYLTPISFRREVLAKYFAEPERYQVSDGRLTCLGLWSCQIDNDLESLVMVFLGDLGRDLPYEERLHWRQFNIAPEGRLSETSFRRSFLGQFADANAADLVFRQAYTSIVRDWEGACGWPLFLTPSPGDSHLLNCIRVPVTKSQSEFDEQIGYLTKLLVDSLNESELLARTSVVEEGAKGITKLDRFLEQTQFPERLRFVQLLRDLQSLRSSGSAHRKGSAYEKITARLNIDSGKKADAVRRLLKEASECLAAMRLHYCNALKRSGT